MKRVIARKKSRKLTKEELAKVSGGTSVFTGSMVQSGNPLQLESTDPGADG